MEAPAWILVIFLSVALFIFLVLGIVLVIALIGVTKEAKKIMLQGQNIAETAGDIAENVRDFTTVGGLVRYFVDNYMDKQSARKKRSSAKKISSKEGKSSKESEDKDE